MSIEEVAKNTLSVLPAQGSYFVVERLHTHDGRIAPRLSPIFGWHVEAFQVAPGDPAQVLPNPVSLVIWDPTTMAIQLPNGEVRDVFGSSWATLGDWATYVSDT